MKLIVISQIIDDGLCLVAWKRNEWIRHFPYPHRTISVIWEIAHTMFHLRQDRINVILDLEGSVISAIIGKWTGCTLRIGLDCKCIQNKWVKGLYTHLLAIPQERFHAVERNLFILQGIGIKEERITAQIQVSEEDRDVGLRVSCFNLHRLLERGHTADA